MDSTNLLLTIFYFTVALISIVMYDKANNSYSKESDRIKSFTSFAYLYKIIQISTLSIAILSAWSDNPMLFKLFENTVIYKYLGVSLSGLGITLFAISRFSLGDNYSPCYDSYIPKSINTSGIYSVIRHPIYTSNLMLIGGVFISSGSMIILINFFILFIYYLFSAFVEEKALCNKFPTYFNYMKRTGMFFPTLFRG